MSFFETVEHQLVTKVTERHEPAALPAAAPAGARQRRRTVRSLALAAAALAVAALVVFALLPGRKGAPTPPGAPASAQAARVCFAPRTAAACLTAIAEIASAQDAIAAGRIWYQRDRWVLTGVRFGPGRVRPGGGAVYRSLPGAKEIFQVVVNAPQRLWLAPDGSGRVDYRGQSQPQPQSRADRRAWEQAGSPDLKKLLPTTANWGPKVSNFSAREMHDVLLGANGLAEVLPDNPISALPPEPKALSARLRGWAWRQRVRPAERAKCPPSLSGCPPALGRLVNATFIGNVMTFLRYPLTPPPVRGALLEVLATVPGSRNLGRMHDSAGRQGAAIELPGAGYDGGNIVLFNPTTSRLLATGAYGPFSINGHKLRMAGDDQPANSANVRWQYLYSLDSGAVDKIGQQPHTAGGK